MTNAEAFLKPFKRLNAKQLQALGSDVATMVADDRALIDELGGGGVPDPNDYQQELEDELASDETKALNLRRDRRVIAAAAKAVGLTTEEEALLRDSLQVDRMAVAHAPAGGVAVGGKDFRGGEFIPGEVLEKATKEEKAAIEGKPTGDKLGQAGPKETGTKPFAESAVVDSSGKLKTVFHGTNAEFDEFDINMAQMSVLGPGFYFTESQDEAGSFGKNVKQVQLAITQPWGDKLNDKARQSLRDSYEEITGQSPEDDIVHPSWAGSQAGDINEFKTDSKRKAFESLKAGDSQQFKHQLEGAFGDYTANNIIQAAGFDGQRVEAKGRTWWVAFKPEQIRIVGDDESQRLANAPKGGVSIGGKFFKGGQFIPKGVLEDATTEEKAAVEGKGAAKPDAGAAKPPKDEVQTKSGATDAGDDLLTAKSSAFVPLNAKGKFSWDQHQDDQGKGAEWLQSENDEGRFHWSPERQKLHKQVVQSFFKDVTPVKDPTFHLMGGGPASGKSTVLDAGNIDLDENTMTVDSDAIKALLPEYREKLEKDPADKTAAAFAHEESSFLAKAIMRKSLTEGYNTNLDGTGDGSLKGLKKKVDAARSAGMKVNANYMSIATDLSVKIANARAEKTGRFVPESIIRNTHRSVSQILPAAMDEDLYDDVNLWDNNLKGEPRLVMSKKRGEDARIHDDGLWKDFVAKGSE